MDQRLTGKLKNKAQSLPKVRGQAATFQPWEFASGWLFLLCTQYLAGLEKCKDALYWPAF